jgi:hypothetical protein
MPLDILVKNVALWGADGLCDLGISGGRFVALEQGAATPAALILDADGRLAVCPALSNRTFISTRR